MFQSMTAKNMPRCCKVNRLHRNRHIADAETDAEKFHFDTYIPKGL